MNNKKIACFWMLMFMNSVVLATEESVNYEEIRQTALTFESQLPMEVNSKLNQKNGSVLVEIFKNCIAYDRPSSFEVVSLVNKKGVVEKAWSNTQTIFGQCATKIFLDQQLEPINGNEYYSILEFTLHK